MSEFTPRSSKNYEKRSQDSRYPSFNLGSERYKAKALTTLMLCCVKIRRSHPQKESTHITEYKVRFLPFVIDSPQASEYKYRPLNAAVERQHS